MQAACAPQDQKIYYYLYNHLGSVAVVIFGDGAGRAATGPDEVEQRKVYTPFGRETWKMRNDVSLYDPDFGFTGQRFEEMLDLTYFKARWYDQNTARFIQADTVLPEGGSQSLNRYSYTVNNPILYTDPSGHSFKEHIGTVVNVAMILSGVGALAAGIVSSAISTAVNGGTFESFAIGAGINAAAGAVMSISSAGGCCADCHPRACGGPDFSEFPGFPFSRE